ncbi:MAG: PKD domain-containing protein, partial [Flavobacteriales bacterium]|nr:PKD domain-containing protein [Flavobacteriales bacterium]
LSVYFSDTSTVGATSWLWDFGDGNTSTQQNPTHNYAVGGTYTVCLTATNSCGTDSTCQSVSVVCGTPTAMFSSVDTGLTFYFTDLSSSQIASWQWDFGDGNTSTLQNPVHSYPQPGSYVVCLIVSNFCGNADTICDTAVVNFPVSIDALIKENLSIYPNPSDNEINIQGLDILSQYSISILDLKGTLVSSASITTSDLFSINIENLSQGSYILNVENENLNTSKRFLFHKK